MNRRFCPFAIACVCALLSNSAAARSRVLLAADDPAQISEVQLGQVMADDSSRWLSVVLKGRARLAVVTAGLDVATNDDADAWLRALDFATRARVAPPSGPLAACPQQKTFPYADSGLPEPALVAAQSPTSAGSELELRRSLTNAGLDVDPAVLDAFSAGLTPPFQVAWFDAQASGGKTAALRWLEHGGLGELPALRIAGRDSVPITLIALASDGVEPVAQGRGDPSEFAVTYFGATASTDYAVARTDWLLENPERWLREADRTNALFDVSVLAPQAQLASASSRYFSTLPGARGAGCDEQVGTARARQSNAAADFSCAGADDLSLSLAELGFGEARLSRWFGALGPSDTAFRLVSGAVVAPRVTATDFDAKGCVVPALPEVPPPNGQSGRGMSPGTPSSQPTVDPGGAPVEPPPQTYVSTEVDVSSSQDSCSGTPSSDPPPANDSCSGDSSSDSSTKDDSCSGNTDSSSGDSSGCGSNSQSGYDGDTCTGNSASSSADGSEQKSSAALEAGSGLSLQHRPRHVRLSLLTLLAAGLSLPLRRRVK